MPAAESNRESRKPIFDRWAADYDRSVSDIARAEEYPFAGYDAVLEGICREAGDLSGLAVLDLGTGTGALARLVLDRGGRVRATDLSARMLEEARAKIPEAALIEADLLSAWPDAIDGPFDRIASAYVLHEFDLPTKISILSEAARRLAPGGRIVIGDIAFPTSADLDAARERWHDCWDHTEHYWAADEAIEAAHRAGLSGRWIAVSICAGLLVFEPQGTSASMTEHAALQATALSAPRRRPAASPAPHPPPRPPGSG